MEDELEELNIHCVSVSFDIEDIMHAYRSGYVSGHNDTVNNSLQVGPNAGMKVYLKDVLEIKKLLNER